MYIAFIIVFIAVVILVSYAGLSLRSASPTKTSGSVLHSGLSTSLESTNLLSYDFGSEIKPYVLFSYNINNISSIYANATIFQQPPPKNFYILNVSDNCPSYCQNLGSIINSVENDLALYGVVPSNSSVSLINMQNVQSMPKDSVLVILDSAMPSSMFSNVTGKNDTLINYLLNKGIDIVYAGGNFSFVAQGDVLVSIPQSSIPSYLLWLQKNSTYANTGFFFNKSTYYLATGKRYGALSYTSQYNGSILIFPNYITEWRNASDAGHDVAKAISQLFWIPSYTYGSSNTIAINQTGKFGFALDPISIPVLDNLSSNNKIGYGRVTVYTNNGYSIGNSSDIYTYHDYNVNFSINGTMSIAQSVTPATSVSPTPTISIIQRSTQKKGYSLHLAIYNENLTQVQTIPLSSFNSTGNITIQAPITLDIPPGQYIAQVLGFYNGQYAAAQFNVSPIVISLTSRNSTSGIFTFSITSSGTQLTNIPYNITVNNLYKSTGTISNGTIVYALPKGAQTPKGNLTFSINMLASTFSYTAKPASQAFSIPTQYVELAVVVVIIFVLITVVRVPIRDEFYIDIPPMKSTDTTAIKLKANEVVSTFDKLNIYNHWKYMPLSVDEVKVAIANNIRYNSMPVNLTHSNIEVLMNQLTSKGFLVSADGLYAPKQWVTQSSHDIEYLATFKKLRIYFLTHAYVFTTEIDASDKSDIIATLHNERVYIVIYSRTSKFQRVPVFPDSKTYIAFLNSDKLEEFKDIMNRSATQEIEELRMYISVGQVKLVDSDNPEDVLA